MGLLGDQRLLPRSESLVLVDLLGDQGLLPRGLQKASEGNFSSAFRCGVRDLSHPIFVGLLGGLLGPDYPAEAKRDEAGKDALGEPCRLAGTAQTPMWLEGVCTLRSLER